LLEYINIERYAKREETMGNIIPFERKGKAKMQVDKDLTGMLKEIVEVGKESIGAEINGVFQMNMSFEDMFKARIGSFIIDKKLINADLFRCSLYVSHLLDDMLSKNVDSYYAVDYFIRGLEEEDAGILREGADLCCFLCILFDGRSGWRMMRSGDYADMGIRLYSLCYSISKRKIAWCMSRNFNDITLVARHCIDDMKEDLS